MPTYTNQRWLIGFCVAALTAPAMSQSYLHAPPTSPDNSSLLPIIRPGWPARVVAVPEVVVQNADLAKSTPDVASSSNGATAAVPSHLSQSQWKRLPETQSRPMAALQPKPVATADKPERLTASIGAFSEQTNEANQLRSAAAQALTKGDAAAAETHLATANAKFPADIRIAISLARVRETRGDWAGAAKAFDTVIALDAGEPRWKIRRAECRYFEGNFAAAVTDYCDAEAAHAPLTVSDYSHFGDAALRANEPAIAEAAFNSLSRLAKDPIPQVELLKGLAALKQGQTDKARDILLRASAIWPRDAALTDALRVASAAHYVNAAGPIADVAGPSAAMAMIENTIIETSAIGGPAPSAFQPVAPALSRWRRTAPKTNTPIYPATLEMNETISPEAEQLQDGWRPATVSSDEVAKKSSQASDDDTNATDFEEPGLLP